MLPKWLNQPAEYLEPQAKEKMHWSPTPPSTLMQSETVKKSGRIDDFFDETFYFDLFCNFQNMCFHLKFCLFSFLCGQSWGGK